MDKKILQEFRRLSGLPLLNENTQALVDFKSFPEDVKNTLFDEYGHFFTGGYDWNTKTSELGSGFHDWKDKYESDMFIKNLDLLIGKTTKDLILKKKQVMSDKKLDAFEELIIPTLGNSVLVPILSKFEAMVLMDPNATIESIEKGFKKAKGIFDKSGSIDHSKIEQSNILQGGGINLPNFESFVNENPEYKGVFNDWKKLFDESMKLSITELNAFRDSTPIDKIRNLRNHLIQFKKNNI